MYIYIISRYVQCPSPIKDVAFPTSDTESRVAIPPGHLYLSTYQCETTCIDHIYIYMYINIYLYRYILYMYINMCI